MDMDNTWHEKTETVGADAIANSLGVVHPNPPEVDQRARIVVCDRASDTAEATGLLRMLGLI